MQLGSLGVGVDGSGLWALTSDLTSERNRTVPITMSRMRIVYPEPGPMRGRVEVIVIIIYIYPKVLWLYFIIIIPRAH